MRNFLGNPSLLSAGLVLMLIWLVGACERTEPKPSAPLSFTVEDNEVYFGANLEGWKLESVSDEPRIHVFVKDGARLLVQLRKYRSTTGRAPTQNDLQAALTEFCVTGNCMTTPLKPGYWVNHYDTQSDASSVLNWDIATFGHNDDLLIAVVKLTPDRKQFHQEIEGALESSLVLERR